MCSDRRWRPRNNTALDEEYRRKFLAAYSYDKTYSLPIGADGSCGVLVRNVASPTLRTR